MSASRMPRRFFPASEYLPLSQRLFACAEAITAVCGMRFDLAPRSRLFCDLSSRVVDVGECIGMGWIGVQRRAVASLGGDVVFAHVVQNHA